MRIQHNIAALNSWRQLGTNQSNSSKNLEKLSSGYRINRAGDDAAGLAISEKMRGQIRGLDMASKNAQDGISLIQTAEGALNETHSILQRMRELAVQSSNGTYQDEVDRENLNKEVDALKSEIDRIATSTHFNKIQLLDGSIGSGSSVSSKAATDPTTSVSSNGGVTGGANASILGSSGAGTTITGTDDTVGSVATATGSITTGTATAGVNAVKQEVALAVATTVVTAGDDITIGSTTYTFAGANLNEIADKEFTVEGKVYTAAMSGTSHIILTAKEGDAGLNTASFAATGDVTVTGASVSQNTAGVAERKAATTFTLSTPLEPGESITIDGTSFTKEQIDAASGADFGAKMKSLIEADETLKDKYTVTTTADPDEFILTAKATGASGSIGTVEAKWYKPAERTLDISTAKAGDTIKIGDTTFELVEEGGTAAAGNKAVAFDKLNSKNTAKNLWEAINSANIDGVGNGVLVESTIKLQSSATGATAKLPKIELGTTATAASGITKTETEGTEHDRGGNQAMRGWTFSKATAAGNITIGLKDKDGNAQTETINIAANTEGREIAEMVSNAINTKYKDAEGNSLYTAEIRDDGALIVTANKAVDTTFDMAANMITAGATGSTIQSDGVIQSQTGSDHTDGGKGASTTLDFSNAGVGDTFSINGQKYEIVDGDNTPLTSGAVALKYNEDKSAMVRDLMTKTGSRYDDTDTFKIAQSGNKLTITNQTVGEASAKPVANLGSVGKNGTIEVGGVTVDFGKSNALNGFKINIATGDANEASIDTDKKAINVTLKEGALADDLKAVLKSALANSGNTELAALANNVKVTGDLKVGTEGTNASTEINFKDEIESGSVITIGDKSYQVGKAGDTLKDGAELLEVAPDADGKFTGAAVADALSKITSDKYTATADGSKLTLTAADGAAAEDIKVTVSDSKSLTFQIGANGSADQRVSLNVDDMSSKGIGIEGINILTADTANSAIDVIDNAINTVSSTRADLGALQNRLEHTVNNLGTTSENLTAAESRIRDVDMAKEMMEFTKNNILTQAAQAMLAQANQQPQGVLQLLQ